MLKIGSPFQPAVPGSLSAATVDICSTRHRQQQQQQQQLATAAAQSAEAVVQQPLDISVAEGIVGQPAPAVFSRSRDVCAVNGRYARHTSALDYIRSRAPYFTSNQQNNPLSFTLCSHLVCRYWIPISELRYGLLAC